MIRKRFLFTGLILLVAAVSLLRVPSLPDPRPFIEKAARYEVRILRDTWGVPHIFGKTNADAAYGLAYAHSEDDFGTLQEGLWLVRGELASVQGKDAAAGDFMVHLLRVWDTVADRYEKDLSPETRALCEAYADGVNHYAALHPDHVWAGTLPVTGQDVAAGFVFKGPFFFGLDNRIEELFGDERRHPVSEKGTKSAWGDRIRRGMPLGSNAFAVSPRRSSDGSTLLAINSHQPWEGPVAWYEAHVHSEEGWNMVGATFPGAPVILMGHSDVHGWAHTVNSPDLVDIYVLEINPENPNQYRYEGKWKDFEVREIGLKVKLFGPLSWTFKREGLWSIYGPAVRQPHGVYAIRHSGMDEIRQVEQWLKMNLARNVQEFESAMQMLAIPSLNCLYADRNGDILYLYNARLPVRVEGYDWEQYLPGDRPETQWTSYLPYVHLPRILDPTSGFLVSCNQSPFEVSGPGDDLNPADFSATLGIETHLTNRSLRALELYGGDSSITPEEFEAYKYDVAYSTRSAVAAGWRELVSSDAGGDPLVDEALRILKTWDLRMTLESPGATLAQLVLRPDPDGGYKGGTREEMLISLKAIAQHLKATHGKVEVPWGEVNRLIRGDENLPLDGGADTLRAIYSVFLRDGKLFGFEDGTVEGKGGDSSIFLVRWDAEGRMTSKAIHPFGSATLDRNSPHYDDQSPLFARNELRPTWMTDEEIRRNLKREYKPGE